ncbi:MAG TPA: ATP-dependent zinc metalloprotease FtsH [Steroidobacteraceae bacterium]|nr:ATP-dependent zinc metalloprotease FtsH [Steroidobacteraceae bacterium]HVP34300.1 ATP-dependent zinc metalloprotease FtsH [Steroidobacteraceae bacterium]
MNEPESSPKKPSRDDEKKRQEQSRRQLHFGISYLITSLVVLWAFQQFVLTPLARTTEIPYSEFKKQLAAAQIVKVNIGARGIVGEMKNPKPNGAPPVVPFNTAPALAGDPKLIEELQNANVTYDFERPPNPLGGILLNLLPLALLGGFWYMAYQRAGGAAGGLGGIFGVGKSKATEVKPEDVSVTYKDVGGADEAIVELQEIIQFLKTPEQFAQIGGHIPKGVLIVGPPGTGKTLLAKATAGEAQVAFFETSGSEFVEMFVGVGAARVRDLFEQARKAAPAIVFIDEIDAIGQSRGGVMRLGGNDEREQTLNQLLAEIDGFKTDTSAPVIIMAATNRPEVLDPALLRAGRFDRQIAIGNPDLIGRTQILRIHSRKVTLAADFDFERAARMTAGFSGADLANAMNEAALLTARRKAAAVTLNDFEAAIERVIAGSEKKSRVMNEQERTTVAYHESGHALVAELVPHGEPVGKISIVPHSRGALGYTMQMPTEDRYLLSIDELKDRIAVMLGGRAAEIVQFATISTGASDDIMRATELARRMVTEFGMSEKLGSVRYAGQQLQYLGGSVEDNSQISPETRQVIDAEIQRLVTEQYERAQVLLKSRRAALKTLAQQLLKEETVSGSSVKAALEQAPNPGSSDDGEIVVRAASAAGP